MQLTTVRFLEDLATVPSCIGQTLRRQLGLNGPEQLIEYAQGEQRWAHAEQIRTEHGYRALTDRGAGFALARWLYAQCWTGTDQPSALFDRATSWMLAQKVLLPGASVLERFVARLRDRVDTRLCRLLGGQLSSTQRAQLETLLRVAPRIPAREATQRPSQGQRTLACARTRTAPRGARTQHWYAEHGDDSAQPYRRTRPLCRQSQGVGGGALAGVAPLGHLGRLHSHPRGLRTGRCARSVRDAH